MEKKLCAPISEIGFFGEYDVVIAGGGVAGFAAGVMAARNGAKTLVIEKEGFLGGTATVAMIGQMIGFTDGQMGIPKELVEKIAFLKGTNGFETVPLAGSDILVEKMCYDPEILKVAMDEMLLEAGADVLLHTTVIDVSGENNLILGVIIHNCKGYQLIKGKVFIDATFHGEVAAISGCKWEMGRLGDGKLQPATLTFRLVNADLDRFRALPEKEKSEIIKQGLAEGKLFTRYIIASIVNGRQDAIFNMSRVLDVDPLNDKSLSKAEREGRRQIQTITTYLRDNVPGFEEAILVGTGSRIGLRDSRRIIGKYVLSKEDIMNGERHRDAIAICSYPIDEHDPKGTGIKYTVPKEGRYYIPFRCLVAEQVKNLIIAGRCISATYDAHASIRIMATCLALGQAAGLAAVVSLQRQEHANELDGSLVSKVLYDRKILL